MNNKVLVEITVPASNMSYDVFIPLDSRMSDVIMLVSNMLSELSNGKYKATENSVLCDAATGMIYNVNLEIAELEIKNAAHLLLI